MLKCPDSKFGLILYWFLINQLTSADGTIICSIIDKMTSINIADSPGQSITAAVAQIRSAIVWWLDQVQMVLNVIVPIIKVIMGTCNAPSFVSSFVSFFAALLTNTKLNKITFTTKDLLTTVKQEYASLVCLGNYNLSTKGGSTSFHGSSQLDETRGSDNKKKSGDNSRRMYKRPAWVSTPAADGKPTVREFEGRSYTWFGIYKRWIYGNHAHTMEEHIPGGGPKGYKKKSKPSTNAAADEEPSEDNSSPTTNLQATLLVCSNALFFSAGF